MSFISSFFVQRHKVFTTIFVMVAAGVFLSGCDLTRNYMRTDRPLEYEREDYRRALAPRPLPPEEAKAPIPELTPFVDSSMKTMRQMPLVTISVNPNIQLRDVLYEIAEQAEINLELDPNITGAIFFTAREKPVDEVIERIANMAGLRYKFDGDFLRVEVDRPYQEVYKMRFLNGERTISTEVSYELDVSADGGDSGGGSGEGGTSVEISQDIDADLWGEIEENLATILQITDETILLRTIQTPSGAVLAPVVNTPAVDQVAQGTADGTGAADGDGSEAPVDGEAVAAAQPDMQLIVPAAPPPEEIESQPANYTINRQAGLISVFATERQHNEVRTYLDAIRRQANTQVLIEARILEVELSDQFATGIDWGAVDLFSDDLGFDLGFSGNFVRGALSPDLTGATGFNLSYNSSDLSVAVDTINRFGTVRALSSPRLTTLNNNTAIMNVTDSKIFFDCESQTDTTPSDPPVTTTTVECDPVSVPIGVILSVQPTVDLDADEITLNIRPVVTDFQTTVTDPAFAGNIIPEIQQTVMDSIVKIKSGRVLVMGGLMKDSNTTVEEGIPVLSDIPLVGNAFKSQIDNIEKTELVIFLKATIIPSQYTHEVDRDLYRDFGSDSRPLRM